MLSVFPNLLSYWLIAPVILRAALGLAFLHEAYAEKTARKITAAIKALIGALFLLGFLTQAAAAAGVIISLYELWQRQSAEVNDRLLLKLAIAAALLFLGPGVLSIDWPL
ncbi:MAG TPA: hypothetical protein VJL36_01395 [Candidatus Paceibacterota bacterium]